MAASASYVLFSLYTLLALYLGGVLISLLAQGHATFHYAVVFHALALLWILLRCTWWLLDVAAVELATLPGDLLFWLPHSILFLTFATLALFLLKLVRRKWWTGALRVRYVRAFSALAAVNIAATVSLAVIDSRLADAGDDAGQDKVQTAESAMNSATFLLLASGFSYLGRSLLALDDWDAASLFALSPKSLSLVAWGLSGIFATRCVFNAASSAGLVDVDTSHGDVATQAEEVGLYLLWEVFPLVLLLATIATARRAGGGGSAAAGREALESFGVFGALRELDEEGVTGGGGGDVSAAAAPLAGAATGAMPAAVNAGRAFDRSASSSSLASPLRSNTGGGGGVSTPATARRLFAPPSATGVGVAAESLGGPGGGGSGDGLGVSGGLLLGQPRGGNLLGRTGGMSGAGIAATRPQFGGRSGGAGFSSLHSALRSGHGGFGPLADIDEDEELDSERTSSARPSEAENGGPPTPLAFNSAAEGGRLAHVDGDRHGALRGSGMTAPAMTASSGFVSAQQQAARRSAYMPPRG